MTQITTSRFRWRTRSVRSVPLFLQKLDVPYRDGSDFWQDNLHHLREIYEAMRDAARERMADLHPDRGGDGHEFGIFVTDYRAAQKSFSRYLVIAPPSASETVKFTPIEQVRRDRRAAQARERRRKNRKAFRAQRREEYRRKRDAGWRDPGAVDRTQRWRKRHPIKAKRLRQRYVAKHIEKVRAWKRASYHRLKAAGKLPKRKRQERKRLIPGTPEHEARLIWRRKYTKRRRRHINALRRKSYKQKRAVLDSANGSACPISPQTHSFSTAPNLLNHSELKMDSPASAPTGFDSPVLIHAT